ncbi:CPBP family intramembrane glutamic endopeptidase [Methylocystis sp.]|uniref:CPBP family intramembrane glutamic endopeptidase n=1 Tax=Methylocystis sp. TaxID=1911079 RepID=UPI0025F410C7|nr:CPBP family intramembrane glutamic endopeptidase [Methylocystis sp.]
MTLNPRNLGPLFAFLLLLLAPSLAIAGGALSFHLRFEALLVVSLLCVAACVLGGYSFAELGLGAPRGARAWLICGALTCLLLAAIVVEAQFLGHPHAPPNWIAFAPFYVLVSSPCQEIVCRSIPKLIADRLQMSGRHYVLFSSAVFSLMHGAYGDPVLLANTFLAGVAWSMAYLFTRNVWPLTASHAAVGSFAFWIGLA